MNDIFVLLIKKEHLNSSKEHFTKDLKTIFKSIDYMNGFLDGYCFDKKILKTLPEFELGCNGSSTYLADYYIFFLSIEPEE